MNDRITISIAHGVADVRLARAAKLNAFDEAMFADMLAAGERLARERGVRAVVLSGEGPAFCSGLDTGNFARLLDGDDHIAASVSTARTERGANRSQQAILLWRELPMPVIAAIHGVAFGAGFQLALAADMRFVAPDARLSAMEINWGLLPDMAGVALLRGLVRDDIARDLVYSGRVVAGAEALAIGLATRVCADPRAAALACAAEIAARSPDAIRAAKRLLALMADASEAEILHAESAELLALLGTPNQTEAVAARLAKRAPVFID